MNWIDVAILVLIAVSALVSLMRGFVREALSLTAWILAFWLALTFAARLAATPLLIDQIDSPTVRAGVAFAVIFLVILLLGVLVNVLVGQLVRKTGLSGTDRIVGALFGVARGIVVVGVLVLLAGFTQLPSEPWWHESMLLPQFQSLAMWMKDFLPPDMQASLRY